MSRSATLVASLGPPKVITKMNPLCCAEAINAAINWMMISAFKLGKTIWQDFVRVQDFKVLFFSNWIPSRFIDSADILVNVEVDEHERIARLKRRYRKMPDKFLIQQAKTTIPIEMPFECDVMMTYTDPHNETRRWALTWLMKRLLRRNAGRVNLS